MDISWHQRCSGFPMLQKSPCLRPLGGTRLVGRGSGISRLPGWSELLIPGSCHLCPATVTARLCKRRHDNRFILCPFPQEHLMNSVVKRITSYAGEESPSEPGFGLPGLVCRIKHLSLLLQAAHSFSHQSPGCEDFDCAPGKTAEALSSTKRSHCVSLNLAITFPSSRLIADCTQVSCELLDAGSLCLQWLRTCPACYRSSADG